MAHMPKRASMHGIHLCSHEVMPIELKPGQRSLDRHVYSEEARMLEDVYYKADLPQESQYRIDIAGVTPVDYAKPVRPIRPSEPPEEGGHRGVAHWRSTYNSYVNQEAVHGSTFHRQLGPSYKVTEPPTCVGAAPLVTTYRTDHGEPGSDPRDRLIPGCDKLPVYKTHLTRGTPKATMHIPGYQGFLATNTRIPAVARAEAGTTLRSVTKATLTDQYAKNIVGYTGHVPLHPKNDRGPVKPTTRTEMGKAYRPPDVMAMS